MVNISAYYAHSCLLFETFDSGDGDLSKSEFIHWKLNSERRDSVEEKQEIMNRMFELFDQDEQGRVPTIDFEVLLNTFSADKSYISFSLYRSHVTKTFLNRCRQNYLIWTWVSKSKKLKI